MNISSIKTRFAPSPTGWMHFGNFRTALFNYLLAKHFNGKFLLRFEDTDKARSDEKYAHALMEDLHWAGLTWDEGPHYQSTRDEIYQEHYARLLQSHQAYLCFCSEEQLALTRKVQLSMGQPPRYPGTCRNLTEAEINTKLKDGQLPVLRFKVPFDEEVTFDDLIKGRQAFKGSDVGDFVIRRSDGSPAFFFSNALDDALMGITHAVRGDDHLANTPRQIWILRALNLPVPYYGHFSMILGNDGAPLSKRNGSCPVHDLMHQGYHPLAINNYLARLGHYNPFNDLMSMEELAECFKFEHISTAPARYDLAQLTHWQKIVIHKMSREGLWEGIKEFVENKIPSGKELAFCEVVGPNLVLFEDAVFWADMTFGQCVHTTEARVVIQEAGKRFFTVAMEVFTQTPEYKTFTWSVTEKTGKQGKALFMPLRAAIMGQTHGPDLASYVGLLGRETVLKRLQVARDLC